MNMNMFKDLKEDMNICPKNTMKNANREITY